MTRTEGDRIAQMVLLVVQDVRRRQMERGALDRTHIYVDRDVADVVYGRRT